MIGVFAGNRLSVCIVFSGEFSARKEQSCLPSLGNWSIVEFLYFVLGHGSDWTMTRRSMLGSMAVVIRPRPKWVMNCREENAI